MKRQRTLPPAHRPLRAVGIDDAPFTRRPGASVIVLGSVCADTRFEALVTTRVRAFGWQATESVLAAIKSSRFYPMLHVILLDGIAVGGLNIIDLEALSAGLERPCIAVMRKMPDLAAMEHAIRLHPQPERRLRILARAGEIHQGGPWIFQVKGGLVSLAEEALVRLTDRGNVPEPLRISHRIGAGLVLGESTRGA
ncbi:MAG: DUF99 family protein [Deltaproteobacteria bacterium]|nr:DUF99 family protein [Deltaproteobacteria bacterium]